MMIVGCEIHPICLIPSSIPPLIISPAVIIRLFKRDLHKKERNTIIVVTNVIAILCDRGSINIFRFFFQIFIISSIIYSNYYSL